MRLYLDIPYAEKDMVKALGGKWSPSVKKWYVDSHTNKYIDF